MPEQGERPRGVRTVKPKPEAIERFRRSFEDGITLGELAKRAEVSERTMNNVMAGKEALLGTMRRIAEVLGVNVRQIAEDEMPPSVAPTSPAHRTFEVRFKLSVPFSTFSYEDFLGFLRTLARLLGGDITDADMQEGSTIVWVHLSAEQITNLIALLSQAHRQPGSTAASKVKVPIPQWLLDMIAVNPLVAEGVTSIAFSDSTGVPVEYRGRTVELRR